LVLRAADWVEPVRRRARTAIATLLPEPPFHYLRPAFPAIAATRDWRRGDFAYAQAVATLHIAPPALRDRLLADSAGSSRSLLLELGLAQGWWPPSRILTLSTDPSEVQLRSRAADLLAQHAVWHNRADDVLAWSRHPRPEVREVAVAALRRLGRHRVV